MGFEEKEKQLREFFRRQIFDLDRTQKARVKERVMNQFSAQKAKTGFVSTFLNIWNTPMLRNTSMGALMLVFFGGFSLLSGDSFAGEIDPNFGLVEIVRDGKTHIVRERTKLKVGDVVQVADNAKAIVTLPEKIVSTLEPETQVRVMDIDKLYIAQGYTNNKLSKTGQISTVRGIIKPQENASVKIDVSETGETRVALAQNSAEIIDWLDGKTVLRSGEEIRLRADSQKLEPQSIPNLNLSTSQIRAIQAKLDIARAKFFTGLEKEILDEDSGEKDFASAQNSFRSIMQVLKSDRQLNILRRTNSDLLANSDIPPALKAKKLDPNVVQEAEALVALFALYKNNPDLSIARGSSEFFGRYMMIDQIFAYTTPEKQALGEVLKEQYVVNLLRKVINNELKLDQITALDAEIEKLPRGNAKAKEFLARLEKYLDPYLAGILEEKIQVL